MLEVRCFLRCEVRLFVRKKNQVFPLNCALKTSHYGDRPGKNSMYISNQHCRPFNPLSLPALCQHSSAQRLWPRATFRTQSGQSISGSGESFRLWPEVRITWLGWGPPLNVLTARTCSIMLLSGHFSAENCTVREKSLFESRKQEPRVGVGAAIFTVMAPC